nr:hypothetical protein [Flammeovirga yaeyamensis]
MIARNCFEKERWCMLKDLLEEQNKSYNIWVDIHIKQLSQTTIMDKVKSLMDYRYVRKKKYGM